MSAVLLPADAESRRFGLAVARGRAGSVDAARLVDAMLALRVDVGIVRVDAADSAAAGRFAAHGLAPLHADCLATWGTDLTRLDTAGILPAEGPLRAAREDDAPAIEDLVHTVFGAYPNHYRANPLFDPLGAVAGYAEWALAHIGRPDKACWVHETDGRIVGLACAAHDAATGVATGNLHGVHPSCARRGIYRAMIRATLAHYAALGVREFSIATQAGNLAVQRVWAELGMQPRGFENTYHLPTLFGRALDAASSPASGTAPARALVDGHARTFGEAALAKVQLCLRSDAGAAYLLRAASVAHRDGGHSAVTLAEDEHGRVIGWARSEHTP